MPVEIGSPFGQLLRGCQVKVHVSRRPPSHRVTEITKPFRFRMDKEAHNYDVCMPGSPLLAQLLAVAALEKKTETARLARWVLGSRLPGLDSSIFILQSRF
jgi:hypothetical protein